MGKENKRTLDDVKEILREMGLDSSILFDSPSYVDAIVGITENGNVCYSYEKMIKCLVDEDGISSEDAEDFVSYNTLRSLNYLSSELKPIIIFDLCGI